MSNIVHPLNLPTLVIFIVQQGVDAQNKGTPWSKRSLIGLKAGTPRKAGKPSITLCL